jgi:hypothetical protein
MQGPDSQSGKLDDADDLQPFHQLVELGCGKIEVNQAGKSS